MPMTAHLETFRIGPSTCGRMAAKRATDILASAIGLTLLIPLFAVIAAAILFDDGAPVFYRQARIGRSGRRFRINKFRSMSRRQDLGSNLTIAGDPRVTRVGAFLRQTKVDELPQLFNVLMGDMSLVGPRPETPDLIVHYTPSQHAAMVSVRPGMTDYASLLLRDESVILARAPDPALFYRERLMPLKYIGEVGLATDFRIILATLWSIIVPSARNPLIAKAVSDRFESVRAMEIDSAP
jgi:lipopolysaccharide/colanic/teichoic acid biosynthesis glycosyltransferase